MARERWTETAPFHVVHRRRNKVHVGYDIYCKNRPFLRQVAKVDVGDLDITPRLKRHEAYALARVLNDEESLRKWADKFGDPYV